MRFFDGWSDRNMEIMQLKARLDALEGQLPDPMMYPPRVRAAYDKGYGYKDRRIAELEAENAHLRRLAETPETGS